MSKVKYINYAKEGCVREEHLYTRRYWCPGLLMTFWPLFSLAVWGMFKWAPFTEEQSDIINLLGGFSTAAIVLVGLIGLFTSAVAVFDNEPRLISFFHYPDERDLPQGFKYYYLNEPEYQTVLKDYMEGKEIDSLTRLNTLLQEKLELERRSSLQKSDIVKIQEEALANYNKALKEIQK